MKRCHMKLALRGFAVALTLAAFAPGLSHAVSITDGNASVDYLTTPDPAKDATGMVGLVGTVTEFDGSSIVIPTLSQSQWWVRIGNEAELSLADHNITQAPSVIDNVVTATFEDPSGRYTIDYTGTLLGSPSPSPLLPGLEETLLIQPTDGAFTMDVFQYTDFDFFEPTRETIAIQAIDATSSRFVQQETFDPPPCNAALESCRPFTPDSFYLLLVAGTGTAEGNLVVGAQAGLFPILRDALDDGVATDLVLDGTTSGADLTFATQFRLDVPGGGFEFTQARLPTQFILLSEPSSALLLALVLGGVALRARRPTPS